MAGPEPNAVVVVTVLIALAFSPALLLLRWVRDAERRAKEPIQALLSTFVYGATMGAVLGIAFNWIFNVGFPQTGARLGVDPVFFALVVGAPFAEELAKGLGFGLARRRVLELEDGIIYGIAIGLGFAATENFVYGLSALNDGGIDLAVTTLVTRVFSSMMLHAGATGLLGFGYAYMRRREGVVLEILPYYLVAVLLHAIYNYLVFVHHLIGFFLAVIMTVTVLSTLRRRIRQLDALPHGQY